jgi:hypothetical protein
MPARFHELAEADPLLLAQSRFRRSDDVQANGQVRDRSELRASFFQGQGVPFGLLEILATPFGAFHHSGREIKRDNLAKGLAKSLDECADAATRVNERLAAVGLGERDQSGDLRAAGGGDIANRRLKFRR